MECESGGGYPARAAAAQQRTILHPHPHPQLARPTPPWQVTTRIAAPRMGSGGGVRAVAEMEWSDGLSCVEEVPTTQQSVNGKYIVVEDELPTHAALEHLSDGDFDEEELENLEQLKNRKKDHLEGESDVEELFPMSDINVPFLAELQTAGSSNTNVKKGQMSKKRRRTFLKPQAKNAGDKFEQSDPGSEDIGGDLISSDDDGFEPPIFVPLMMKKSRAQPLAPRTYSVNVIAKTCSCRKWDLTGIPCKHAVSCIYKMREHPEDYVSDFFKKPMYQLAYNNMIFPVPSKHEWTRTESPDIDPPIFTRHPGRPKKNRRKGIHEVPQPSGNNRMTTTTCSNCKLQGHKYPQCGQPLRPELEMRRRKHKSNRRFPDDQDREGATHEDGAGLGGEEAAATHADGAGLGGEEASATHAAGAGLGGEGGATQGSAVGGLGEEGAVHESAPHEDDTEWYEIYQGEQAYEEYEASSLRSEGRGKMHAVRRGRSNYTNSRMMGYLTASGNK